MVDNYPWADWFNEILCKCAGTYIRTRVTTQQQELVGGWTNPSEKIFLKMGNLPQMEIKIRNHHLGRFDKFCSFQLPSTPTWNTAIWVIELQIANLLSHLVGGWTNRSEKIWSSNWIISPGFGMKIKKIFELPPGRPAIYGWSIHPPSHNRRFKVWPTFRHRKMASRYLPIVVPTSPRPKYGSMKNWMGPNPNGPRSVRCDRDIRYSGFFGVRSVGPTVGDFLEWMFSFRDSKIRNIDKQTKKGVKNLSLGSC